MCYIRYYELYVNVFRNYLKNLSPNRILTDILFAYADGDTFLYFQLLNRLCYLKHIFHCLMNENVNVINMVFLTICSNFI